MVYILDSLKKCPLFHNLAPRDLEQVISKLEYQIKEYPKDGVIALEDDNCTFLGIIIKGTVDIQKIFSSGKVVMLVQLSTGNMFGEAIVFSKAHQYPATIIAHEKTTVLFIKGTDIIKICSKYPQILQNFMELLSERILMLNKKIRALSLDTIRQKIANYLFGEYKKQQTLCLKLDISKKKLAEQMGIQRPSLSRELIKMQEDGIIKCTRDKITILDLESIENYCY